MKCIFTLGSPAVGGGTNVIFEHATRMKKDGVDVYIVCDHKVTEDEVSWHSLAHTLKFITYDELEGMEFDVAIATWWRTVYELYHIKAKKYLYFVQSIESKFYKEEMQAIRMLAEFTYNLNLRIITEATWIKEYLETRYGADVILVLNGIRKDLFTEEGESYDKPYKGLRVLVEGPVDVDFKNVPKTIELARQSDADEIWLLTSSDVKDYEGVDRVFSRVSMMEVHKVYRSVDVVIKLSYVEGMFGPPLETFHCGGTAIVYDVTGHDEYIVHEKNGLVVKTDDEKTVVEYINRLKDKKYLNKLKKGAKETAKNWPNWEQSSKEFHQAVKDLMKKESISQEVLTNRSKFFFEIYEKFENRMPSLRTFVGYRLKNNHKIIYRLLKKIVK